MAVCRRRVGVPLVIENDRLVAAVALADVQQIVAIATTGREFGGGVDQIDHRRHRRRYGAGAFAGIVHGR